MLNEHFVRSISTRSAVRKIFDFDKSGLEEVIIDFSDIYLISSTASHQFILEIRKLEEENIPVNINHTRKNVKKMLELAKTDRKNIFTVQNIKRTQVMSDDDLSAILLNSKL